MAKSTSRDDNDDGASLNGAASKPTKKAAKPKLPPVAMDESGDEFLPSSDHRQSLAAPVSHSKLPAASETKTVTAELVSTAAGATSSVGLPRTGCVHCLRCLL